MEYNDDEVQLKHHTEAATTTQLINAALHSKWGRGDGGGGSSRTVTGILQHALFIIATCYSTSRHAISVMQITSPVT